MIGPAKRRRLDETPLFAFALVDIDNGEVALAAGGDIETEAEGGRRSVGA